MPEQPPRSALVDLIMKDATEEEKAEASRYWFEYIADIVDRLERERRKEQD